MWLPLVHPLLETWTATQACALTRNRTSDPSICRLALNEPHQGHTGVLFGVHPRARATGDAAGAQEEAPLTAPCCADILSRDSIHHIALEK